MQDDPLRSADAAERWRKRNARLLRHRYREGFDRLGIVLFALFAIAFGLVWAFVSEPYALPEEGTPQAAAIASELESACRTDLEEALVLLCRERVLGSHRWAFYSARLAVDRYGWLYAVLLLVLVAGAAWPAGRWIVAGFRRGRSSG